MEKNEFIEMLRKDYHYPEAAIKTDVPKKFDRFDVLIQKGSSYIQAFEIKQPMPKDTDCVKKQLAQMARSLNEFSVDTPIYFATKNINKWEIYAYNDLNSPLDLESILNYQEASRRFFGLVKDSVSNISKCFKWTCWISAFAVGLFMVSCCISENNGFWAPINNAYLILLSIILMLVLLPSLLQMTDKIKRFKLGIFEWEFFKGNE